METRLASTIPQIGVPTGSRWSASRKRGLDPAPWLEAVLILATVIEIPAHLLWIRQQVEQVQVPKLS